jgi:hypothetical protein
MPIIKAAQKQSYNTKIAQIHKTNKQTNRQTNRQTNKQKKTILQEKIYKSTRAKPLYSEETQVTLFKKKSPSSAQNLFSEKNGLPKDVGNFAHAVCSRHTSRCRRDFTRSSEQRGVSDIARRNTYNGGIQQRWATF